MAVFGQSTSGRVKDAGFFARYFFFARLTRFACLANAVRTLFGSFAIVFFRRADAAAFLTFLRAARTRLLIVMPPLSAAGARRQHSARIKNVSGAATGFADAYGSAKRSPKCFCAFCSR